MPITHLLSDISRPAKYFRKRWKTSYGKRLENSTWAQSYTKVNLKLIKMFTRRKIEWNITIIIREGEVVKKTVIDSERLEICAVVTIFRVKVSCISSVYGIKQSLNEF